MSKVLDAIERITKVRIFLISLSITFFLIRKFEKKKTNLGSELSKIKLQKIAGNLLDKLRKLYMNRTVI